MPVVGMDDPSDPSVLGSVTLGAALEAARAGGVELVAALDVAATTAVDNGDERLELAHVRLGIEDWRDR